MEAADPVVEFEDLARRATSVQNELLSSILSRNASCLYLVNHGLEGHTDAASFKAHIPVVEYEDISKFIQRTADGDLSPVLTCSPISHLVLSSGTTAGKPKMFPVTAESGQFIVKRFLLSNAILKRAYPSDDGGKTLYFTYAGKLFTTKSGLKAGASSSHYLRRGSLLKSLPDWTSPIGVVLGSSIRESMYCHLLCGLLQASEVTVISSFLAYGITEAFRFMEDVWEELCQDIRQGTLSDRVTDELVRSDVVKRLHADPELAETVYRVCENGDWYGIIKRIWPNVKYIHTIFTGAMEPYLQYLKTYAGDIPLVCGDYGSSECSVGINMNPMTPIDQVSYTLLPNAAYFEFVELNEEAGKEPVEINGVEIGKEYEVIVTTVAGLYRYRLGDVVRITGFYYGLPQFAFVRRKNVVLSLNTDKTDEKELCMVVKKAGKLLESLSMDLIDFTSHADHHSRPGHYEIFWELKNSTNIQDSILLQCCKYMDSAFNDPYQRGRAAGTIGPLRLYIVKELTFQNIMLQTLHSGVSPVQYKTPRCVNSPGTLEILRSSAIRVYDSL